MIKQDFKCNPIFHTKSEIESRRTKLEDEISSAIKEFNDKTGKMPNIDLKINYGTKKFSISVLDENFVDPS